MHSANISFILMFELVAFGIKMKAFLVLFASLALANCEAPLTGYNYEAPAQSDFNIIPHLFSREYTEQPSQEYFQQYSQYYQQPSLQYAQQYLLQYEHAALQYQPHYLEQQAAEVHKHIYVHLASEKPEPALVRYLPTVTPPQKHYKIIFIKTPSAPSPAPLVVQQQPQIEEKTLIYVLSKNTEEQKQTSVVLPTPAATAPSKPEVYFIKYNAQKEYSGAVTGSNGANDASVIEELDSGVSVESALRASDLSRLGGRVQPGVNSEQLGVANGANGESVIEKLDSGVSLEGALRTSDLSRLGARLQPGEPASQYGTSKFH